MPQNNHKIKSEYAKSFKTYKEAAQTEYSANIKFRLARRNQEVSHQPWAWLDIDLSEDENEGSNVSKPDSKSERKKDESEVEIEDHISNETNSNFDASGAVEITDIDSDRKLIQQLKKKAMKRAMEMRRDSAGDCRSVTADYCDHSGPGARVGQKNQSNCVPRRPHHPVKGNMRTFQPSTALMKRDHDKSDGTQPKNLATINRDKMFMSYGWGSRSSGDEGLHKKTFNIKSDIDVYPSAIRASKTRETFKLMKDKSSATDSARPKTAAAGKGRDKTSARNIDLDNRAAMDWLSEYQFRFPIYDNDVYRRGLANLAQRGQFARLDTPRTCRI